MSDNQNSKLIESCWEDYYQKTASASAICRQISYAGVAVVWILASNDAGEIVANSGLLFPTLGFVLALGFDFLQYFGSSVVWHVYCKWLERRVFGSCPVLNDGQSVEDYQHPKHINLLAEVCFFVKCSALLFGYVMLGVYLYDAAMTAAP